jgi:hypothetical protein
MNDSDAIPGIGGYGRRATCANTYHPNGKGQ